MPMVSRKQCIYCGCECELYGIKWRFVSFSLSLSLSFFIFLSLSPFLPFCLCLSVSLSLYLSSLCLKAPYFRCTSKHCLQWNGIHENYANSSNFSMPGPSNLFESSFDDEMMRFVIWLNFEFLRLCDIASLLS